MMVCSKCINFDSGLCHLDPVAIKIHAPDDHWCSKGVWPDLSNRLGTSYPFLWNDWGTLKMLSLINLN